MHLFKHIKDLQLFLENSRKEGKSIGFVPTMGALHAGHLSLIERAKSENNLVVCSIFVNPIQFNDKKDLENYPRPIDADIKLLINAQCDVLFNPDVEEVFPDYLNENPELSSPTNVRTNKTGNVLPDEEKKSPVTIDHSFYAKVENLDLQGIDQPMEGKYRQGHFKGVMKVVYRLFDIVNPDKAYFGEKDFQQLAIIRKMAGLLSLPVHIVACAIKREENGLAMSSRNLLLTDQERQTASFIYATLCQAKKLSLQHSVSQVKEFVSNEIGKVPSMRLEYFEIVDESSLQPADHWGENKRNVGCIALFLGKVRLIDNIIF